MIASVRIGLFCFRYASTTRCISGLLALESSVLKPSLDKASNAANPTLLDVALVVLRLSGRTGSTSTWPWSCVQVANFSIASSRQAASIDLLTHRMSFCHLIVSRLLASWSLPMQKGICAWSVRALQSRRWASLPRRTLRS